MHLIGNEEAAAYMAWATWHSEQKLGCACVIGGPGVTHALAGVACALRDRTPMLVLTAGVRAGSERFQLHDVDNLAVLKPVCKALFRPASVEEIGESISEACKAALTGRPGPVGVEIACDLYNKRGLFEWVGTELPVPEAPAPTFPVASVQNRLADDAIVGFIHFLTKEVDRAKMSCTLVAEPGYCAEVAAVAKAGSTVAWELLCPGCGARPSSFAADSPGVAVPTAIAAARARAGRSEGSRGLVVALQEDAALLPQGLELSHAHGLPLLILTVRSAASTGSPMDVLELARGLGLGAHEMDAPTYSQNHTNALVALQDALASRTTLLAVRSTTCRLAALRS